MLITAIERYTTVIFRNQKNDPSCHLLYLPFTVGLHPICIFDKCCLVKVIMQNQ